MTMDVDEAWDRFQSSEEPFIAFRKSSIDGKLDTIAAQIQEMSTDIDRMSEIVPQIMGDRGALEADEQDPIDMVLGEDQPDLSSLTQGATASPAGGMAEGVPEGAPEGAPEEEEAFVSEEETVEKADDRDGMDDVRESAEEVDEIVDTPEGPEDVTAEEVEVAPEAGPEPAPIEVSAEEISVDTPEGLPSEDGGDIPVETVEPAGQEGIPPEGVPDLLDEINMTQPDGLLNVYDRFIEGMKQAAHQLVDSGHLGEVTNLAGAQNAIENIWRSQVLPLTEPIMKSGDSMKQINTGEQNSDIQSAHEVPLPAPDTEGEANTTGHDNDATQAPAEEGRTTAQAPHALNNDTTTVGSDNPASFEKSTFEKEQPGVPFEGEPEFKKDAGPVADGQGMEPVEKSLSELEGASDSYEDPITDDSYIDPIRKSVPSFREIMAESKEERFMKMAEMRHGPHKSMDQFMKHWYGEDAEPESEKSMTAGEPMEGMDGFEKESDVYRVDGEGEPDVYRVDGDREPEAPKAHRRIDERTGEPIYQIGGDPNAPIDWSKGDYGVLEPLEPGDPYYMNAPATSSDPTVLSDPSGDRQTQRDAKAAHRNAARSYSKITGHTSMPMPDEYDAMTKSGDAMTAGTEGASNPVYGDDIAKSTAGQPGPTMSMEKACDQLSETDGAFEKSDADTKASTGTASVGEELQGPVCDEDASTGLDDVDTKMNKSMANGKPIQSIGEMISFRKNMPYTPSRPVAISTANGDITRPSEDSFRKAAGPKPVVRMGFGVRHQDVVKQDLEEYRIYKTQRGY